MGIPRRLAADLPGRVQTADARGQPVADVQSRGGCDRIRLLPGPARRLVLSVRGQQAAPGCRAVWLADQAALGRLPHGRTAVWRGDRRPTPGPVGWRVTDSGP